MTNQSECIYAVYDQDSEKIVKQIGGKKGDDPNTFKTEDEAKKHKSELVKQNKFNENNLQIVIINTCEKFTKEEIENLFVKGTLIEYEIDEDETNFYVECNNVVYCLRYQLYSITEEEDYTPF